MSIAIHHRLVYVANAGPAGPQLHRFILAVHGRLLPIPDRPSPLPDDSQPGDVLFNGDDQSRRNAGGNLEDRQLHGWVERPADGRARDRRSPPRGSARSAASSVRPIPVSCSSQTPTHRDGFGTVSAFSDSRHRGADSIGSSPFADLQIGALLGRDQPRRPLPVRRQYRDAGSISSYSITGARTLLIGSTPVYGAVRPRRGGRTPQPRRPHPVRRRQRGRAVSAFAVNSGTLAERATSPTPLPAGATAAGIVVN